MSKGSRAFKACLKCRALVKPDEEKCPVCGSSEFTYEWSGIVIIVDPQRSDVARILNIKMPGRYALKVGV